MAHEIETMAYAGETPWHGLGTELDQAAQYDWQSTCKAAGLDWEPELVPLVTQDTHTMTDHHAVVRSTDRRILGVVGARYTPLRNEDAFKFFQPFLESKEAQLHTAGALGNGARVWVLAKLNREPLEIVKNDLVDKFILLSHSHDGTQAVRVGFTPIRVVCANTLAMAHRSNAENKLIRIRHTKNVLTDLDNVRDIMNLANADFEATAEQYRLLARRSINQADLRKYVARVLEVTDDDKLSTRSRNIIADICRLAEEGLGNDLVNVTGTYWAAFNGVTEYLSYQRGNNADNRLTSLWFGPGADLNARALETALEMAS